MKVLLIEDDTNITIPLSQALASAHTVDIARTGEQGLNLVAKGLYSVIILDLNLPDLPGAEICATIRRRGVSTPLLILSGDNQILNKIKLLDAGADDYLTKPFSLGELKARLRALDRHNHGTRPVQSLQVQDIIINPATYTTERQGSEIALRLKEFMILECLMQRAGAVVSRKELADYAWPAADQPWSNTIDVHIKYLRDKVDKLFPTSLIKTVHGVGYMIEA